MDEFPDDQQDLHAQVYYAAHGAAAGGGWAMRCVTCGRLDGGAGYGGQEPGGAAVWTVPRRKRCVERFTKDPPYAYVIPREQRDRATAALLVEKLLIDGIEVHQGAAVHANGSRL